MRTAGLMLGVGTVVEGNKDIGFMTHIKTISRLDFLSSNIISLHFRIFLDFNLSF